MVCRQVSTHILSNAHRLERADIRGRPVEFGILNSVRDRPLRPESDASHISQQ